jgi:hypothetical protein
MTISPDYIGDRFWQAKLPFSQWDCTHINKRNFLKAPTSKVEDKGTILARDRQRRT